MRVLVTGGIGFIGTNLSDRLLRDGHEVSCIRQHESRGRAAESRLA